MQWHEIDGWFNWRSGQEAAVRHFPAGSCFVEVGIYLGRSLCSLGEVVEFSGKRFTVIGIDTCRGSGPEGPKRKDYHGAAVVQGGGTFAGTLHRNILECGYGDAITLIHVHYHWLFEPDAIANARIAEPSGTLGAEKLAWLRARTPFQSIQPGDTA